MVVQCSTCLHGFSYFLSALKSIGSTQGTEGGSRNLQMAVSLDLHAGSTDWEKDQTRGRMEGSKEMYETVGSV